MTRPIPMTGPAAGGATAKVVLWDEAVRRQIADIEQQRRQAWRLGDAETEAFLEREARELRASIPEAR